MPFALAHPAAALPFSRCGLPLSALVAGSMAPDFPYSLHLSGFNQYGHTLGGLFWFCLPSGFAALAVFHGLLKMPLLGLLPRSHQTRLVAVAKSFRFFPLRQLFLIGAALLLGAFTHIAWDSFTHANGWFVQHIPLLKTPLLRTSRGALHLYKTLQHGSGAFGVLLCLLWYAKWFKAAATHEVEIPMQMAKRWKIRSIFLMSFVAAMSAFFLSDFSFVVFHDFEQLQTFARSFVVASMTAMAAQIFVFSLLWQWKMRTKRELRKSYEG
jgi:hypothetical protein